MSNSQEYSNDEELIARFLTGEPSEEEKLLVRKKMEEDNSFRKTYFEMSEILNVADADAVSDKFNVNKAIERFLSRTKQAENKIPKNKALILISYFTGVAAAVLLAIFILKFNIENKKIEVNTANNILHNIVLPDGTKIDLNRNTKFQYFKKFKKQREVFLAGEAYFSVKKLPSSPFIVNIGNICVKVLGTSFNIKAYPGQQEIIVTVNSGQVQFYLKNNDKIKIILTAGETGKFSAETGKFTGSKNIDLNYASWKTNIITFDKTKFSDAIDVLQQQYNAKISLQNKTLGNCKITATFDNQTLDSILNMLEISFDLSVIKNDSIILVGKGCY